MATKPDLRIGDADREAAAAALREHYAQGRLSLDEFNQRLSATFTSVTQRDLDAIASDLPHVRSSIAPLPDAAGGSGRGGAGRGGTGRGSGPGSARRQFAAGLGLIAALAVLAVALLPAIWGFGLGAGRFGILAIGLVIVRTILRRIFGLRRFGGGLGRGRR